MHAEFKQYLDQPQDKDRHEGEDLPSIRHGSPSAWLRNLDSHQGKLQSFHMRCQPQIG